MNHKNTLIVTMVVLSANQEFTAVGAGGLAGLGMWSDSLAGIANVRNPIGGSPLYFSRQLDCPRERMKSSVNDLGL